MHALVGFAESNHDNPVQTTLLFDALDIDGYSYDYPRQQPPAADHLRHDAMSTSPATWTLSQIRLRPQSTINSFQTAGFDLEWAARDSFTLKFGPHWKNYIFKSTEVRRSNGTTANIEAAIPVIATDAPIASYSFLTRLRRRPRPAGGQRHDLADPGPDRGVDVLDLNDRAIYPMGIAAGARQQQRSRGRRPGRVSRATSASTRWPHAARQRRRALRRDRH